MQERPFDVVLWGATGFTGRLVAGYLLSSGESFRWALAGRDKGKLEAVRRDLEAVRASAGDVPILVADRADPASLAAMVRQTRVVCTTVGPYAKYGRELPATCVALGTDYCDITGEVPFIRGVIDAHHEEAARRGVRIVHCCGFDSIPSDLGVHMVHDHAKREGRALEQARFFLVKSRGGFSGGTIASMMNLIEEATTDRALRRLVADPYALNPEGERSGPDGPDQRGVGFDRESGRFTAPFVMASVNTRVVRRSNALLGYAYGRDFRYAEVMRFARGPAGLLSAAAVTAGLGGFAAAAVFPPTRRLLERFALPAPGEGPSKEERDRGHFLVEIHATTRGDGGHLVGRVAGTSDPGYGETAKMLGESALCLAMDRDATPAAAGVLTPASAMGMPLVERLRRAGMTFQVEATPAGS